MVELEKRRGYLARELVQCTLPHRQVKGRTYRRTDGNFTFMIEAGSDPETGKSLGLPYGTIPRLLLLWLTSEAVRTQNPEIVLGNTLNDFLIDIGLNPKTGGGKRGDAKRLAEQVERLFNARFSFSRSDGDAATGSKARLNMSVGDAYTLWWDYSNPEQGSFFQSSIRLNDRFFEALRASPVPFNVEAIKAIKRSPLAIDLYCWLCWRTFRIAPGKRQNIPLRELKEQFGGNYERERDFKAALSGALKKICLVQPELKARLSGHALIIEGVPKEQLPIPPENANEGEGGWRDRRMPGNPYALSARELERIKARYPGWDLSSLRQEWEAWCRAREIVPAKPAAHFSRFVGTHQRRNGKP